MTDKKNPLINLLQSITDVVNDFLGKDRSVSISAIWQTVQKSLDGTEAEGGMEMPTGYVLDIYEEEAGPFAVITKSDGKLYKVPVAVDANSQITLGAEQEVVMDFSPVTGRQVTIKRMADGKVRWFAMPACTAVLNRDGEIDSRALFDSFVEHIERTGNYPELDFFHLGEDLPLGKADWVARDGYTYCASGTFYDTPLARAAVKALEDNSDYWGLSIAYLPTKEPEKIRSSEGIEINVFNAGINRFISLLPEDTAASILTNISTKEEVNRMNQKQLDALKKLVGDDKEAAGLIDEINLKLNSINREADGMISREAAKDAPAPAATPAPVTRELTDADVTMVVGSDAFKTAVREIVTAMDEERKTETEEEKAKKVPASEAAPVAATETARAVTDPAILDMLNELKSSVAELSKNRTEEVQAVLNDLPARISRTNIIRPRATRMPDNMTARNSGVSLAEIANETLGRMGEHEGA